MYLVEINGDGLATSHISNANYQEMDGHVPNQLFELSSDYPVIGLKEI